MANFNVKKKRWIAIGAELLRNYHGPALCRYFEAFIVEIVEMQDDGNVALEKT